MIKRYEVMWREPDGSFTRVAYRKAFFVFYFRARRLATKLNVIMAESESDDGKIAVVIDRSVYQQVSSGTYSDK